MEDPEVRNLLGGKGTVRRAVEKLSNELEARLQAPMFGRWVSKTRLFGAAFITADATAVFTGWKLSAIGTMSLIGQRFGCGRVLDSFHFSG